MVTSPSFCCSRAISSSRASRGRFSKTAWRPEELLPPLGESGGSHAQFPGKQFQVFTAYKRRTISISRRAEKRLLPWPGPSPVALRAPSAGPGRAPPR